MTNIEIAKECGASDGFGNDVPGCSPVFILTDSAIDAFVERIRADERAEYDRLLALQKASYEREIAIERERAELDAKRYRWLRSPDGCGDSNVGAYRDARSIYCEWLVEQVLDSTIDAAIRAAIQQEPAAPAERSAKLEAFFSEVVDLTLRHAVLTIGGDDDVAVVYPSKLGEALERVDPNWAAIRQQELK